MLQTLWGPYFYTHFIDVEIEAQRVPVTKLKVTQIVIPPDGIQTQTMTITNPEVSRQQWVKDKQGMGPKGT